MTSLFRTIRTHKWITAMVILVMFWQFIVAPGIFWWDALTRGWSVSFTFYGTFANTYHGGHADWALILSQVLSFVFIALPTVVTWVFVYSSQMNRQLQRLAVEAH